MGIEESNSSQELNLLEIPNELLSSTLSYLTNEEITTNIIPACKRLFFVGSSELNDNYWMKSSFGTVAISNDFVKCKEITCKVRNLILEDKEEFGSCHYNSLLGSVMSKLEGANLFCQITNETGPKNVKELSSNCTNLRGVVLGAKLNDKNNYLRPLMCDRDNLKTLITNSNILTSDAIKYFSINTTSLETFEVIENDSIDDTIVEMLVSNNSNLKTLRLSMLKNITALSLRTIRH